MTPRDGQRVKWSGYPSPHHSPSDLGKVLSAMGSASHVMWDSGSVELVANEHLASLSTQTDEVSRSMDDSLSVPASITSTAIREEVEEGGIQGMLEGLVNTGALWSLAQLTDDVTEFAERAVRENPEVHQVMAHLDSDEQSEFIATVATHLFREAARSESDG